MQQICDKHSRIIRFICIDNSCKSKLLCEECQKLSNEHATHKVLDYITFMNNFEAFIKGQPANSSVYGGDVTVKTRMYMNQTDNIRAELKSTHLRSLEEGCEKYLGQLSDGLIKAKKTMIEFVQEAADVCYSHQILNNRDSLRAVSQILLETLETHISVRQANSLLYKLHTGELEREYQEEKIKALVDLFQYHMKYILDPLAAQVNKYLNRFSKDVENLKDSIRQNHFQMNLSNMNLQKPTFKLEELPLDENYTMKIQPPISITNLFNQQVKNHRSRTHGKSDLAMETLDQIIESQLKSNPIIKLSKNQVNNLLQSLDYTNKNLIRKASAQVKFRVTPSRTSQNSKVYTSPQ